MKLLQYPRLVFLFVICAMFLFFSNIAFGQGYVVEMQGEWKKTNGVTVKNRTSLKAYTKLVKASQNADDAIFIADENGKIVASCQKDCDSVVVPNTQSWGQFLWCSIISCNSTKYTAAATKDNCLTFDGIVETDNGGVTDLTSVLTFFSNESKLNLKFMRKRNGEIEENKFEIDASNPRLNGLNVGFYEVVYNNKTSRLLVLPIKVFEREKKDFEYLKAQIKIWQESGLSNCTIKSFTQAYIDYVEKKNRKELSNPNKGKEA